MASTHGRIWSRTSKRTTTTPCGAQTETHSSRALGYMSTITVVLSTSKPLLTDEEPTTFCHCLKSDSAARLPTRRPCSAGHGRLLLLPSSTAVLSTTIRGRQRVITVAKRGPGFSPALHDRRPSAERPQFSPQAQRTQYFGFPSLGSATGPPNDSIKTATKLEPA